VRNIYKKLLLPVIIFIFVISRICSIFIFNVRQNEIIKRAKDMTYVKWIPPEDIVMWNSNEKFQKGKRYEGIPYTWSTNQVRSSKEFLQDLNSKNKLEYMESNYIEPNYGNDCSGFVSAAWNIPRCTTYTIKKYAKNIGFEELKPGDALLSEFHIMLFSNWNNTNHSSLTVYEQTPPKARIQIYTVSYLKSKKYQPIRLK
jgi:hypothetical protein